MNRFDPDGRFGKDINGNPYSKNAVYFPNEDGTYNKVTGYRADDYIAAIQSDFQNGSQRSMAAYYANLNAQLDHLVDRMYDDSAAHQFMTTLEIAAMVATDGLLARVGNPQMTQLQLNQMTGRVGEEQASILLGRQDIEILGEHVTARIDGEIRYIDKLARTPGNQLVAVEVKAGDATRGASQVAKDTKMATTGAVLGNNAPADLQGYPVVIPTFVLRVPGAAN